MGSGTTEAVTTRYITGEAELRELVGDPGPAAHAKVLRELDAHARHFIANSRFCLLGTAGADGCDVSPRGEPGAVALVLDDKTLVLPDRPGNKRVDSFRNILHDPHVGMLFLMPPMAETLRINGRARLVREAPYFARLTVNDRPPRFAVEITVDEVYLHCAKALLRSDLWDPQSWNDRDALPRAAQIWRDHAKLAPSVEELEAGLAKGYSTTLY
jgi:PPOX class probable FMN-dependent enzyme